MHGNVFGHAIETIHEGLSVNKDGQLAPMPLAETRVHVDIRSGLAHIRTTRVFRNAEDGPIEAILTMPVGFDSVVTGLHAEIDGRCMTAIAAPKAQARLQYEEAIDKGKMAILHEEVLRGVHMLSVGQLGPEKTVSVEIETMCALSVGANGPFLRIPMTVGQIYGVSPLAPTDDLTASAEVVHEATLSVTADRGRPVLGDGQNIGPEDAVSIVLDQAIEIDVHGGMFGAVSGVSADGRNVEVRLKPLEASEEPLNIAVLFDNSGSTGRSASGMNNDMALARLRSAIKRDGDPYGELEYEMGVSVLDAAKQGLTAAIGDLAPSDRIDVWQFGSTCRKTGGGKAAGALRAIRKVSPPSGSTELGKAINEVVAAGAKDILIVTDGQTWAHAVDRAAREGVRLFAIVVGPGSLDVNVGRLCAQTGGQLFFAKGDDVETPAREALNAVRLAGSVTKGKYKGKQPKTATAIRSGVEINVEWSGKAEEADAVGRFAAEIAMPMLPPDAAEDWARAHALCTHRTSLILVDDAGEASDGLSQTRKVPLMATAANRRIASANPRREMPAFLAMAKAHAGDNRPSSAVARKLSSRIDGTGYNVANSHRKVYSKRAERISIVAAVLALIGTIFTWIIAQFRRLRSWARGRAN